MFKVLVLQNLYNLSDGQMEFMIRARLSFMRFLGLGLEDRVPPKSSLPTLTDFWPGRGARPERHGCPMDKEKRRQILWL